MICSACTHEKTKKHGFDSKSNRRRRCVLCGKTETGKRPSAPLLWGAFVVLGIATIGVLLGKLP